MASRSVRLPRALHPGAWWVWALGMAAAASRTTNPILLVLVVAVVASVVSARRTDAPWASGFRAYLVLGLVVVAIRVGFRVLLDGQHGEHVLLRLPEVPLPAAAAGIRLGGPVSAEGVLATACASPPCSCASARPTCWPTPSGSSRPCLPRSTRSAWL